MNAHPQLAQDRLRSASRGEMTPLKAWRKRQMVPTPLGLRAMRITDAEPLYGIKAGTWHSWEQPVGHPAFRRPDDEHMKRLCVEITKGEIRPEHFYPVEEWREKLKVEGPITGGG
jgi:hypothetical protein